MGTPPRSGFPPFSNSYQRRVCEVEANDHWIFGWNATILECCCKSCASPVGDSLFEAGVDVSSSNDPDSRVKSILTLESETTLQERSTRTAYPSHLALRLLIVTSTASIQYFLTDSCETQRQTSTCSLTISTHDPPSTVSTMITHGL